MKRQSLYFTAPREVELREELVPSPGLGEATVETMVSAISAGTEMLVYRGEAPSQLSADTSIAALAGDLAFPLKYGYATVGRVVEVGEAVDRAGWIGRLVFAFNPHETHFTAPVDSLMPLPQGILPEQALFLPNMETAVSLLHDGAPLLGERVVVFGQGIVGLLTTALLARLPLDSIITLDRYPNRREAALMLGAHTALDPIEEGDQLRDLLPDGADLTYELSGAPAALDAAIEATGFAGRVVVGSWYGVKPVPLTLGGHFHRSRMAIISSQVSSMNPALSGRWNKERRFATTWDMIKRVDPTRLLTHRIPFGQAAEAFTLVDGSPQEAIQVILRYG